MTLKSFFNERAEIWDETVAEKDVTKLADMAKSLDIQPGATVLDVGTGTGVFVPFILSRIGQSGKLVCLDFAEEMLKKAQAKGFEGHIEYICADITDTRLDDRTFDAVICYSSFPHFQDKSKALDEIKRVLKNGGSLLICHTSSRHIINEIHRGIPTVCQDIIPDEDDMRQMLSAHGFIDIKIHDNSHNYLVSARKPGQGESL